MACISPSTDLTTWTVATTDCRLTFTDPAGDTLFAFDMGTLIAKHAGTGNDRVILCNDKSQLTLTGAQMTQIGQTVASLNSASGQCRFGGTGGGTTGGVDLSAELEPQWIYDDDAGVRKWLEVEIVRATGTKSYTFYDKPSGTAVAAPTGSASPPRVENSNNVTDTDVTAAAASTLLIAANPLRKRVIINNNNALGMRVSLGDAADANDILYSTDEYFVEEDWKGAIFGIWEAGAAGQGARVSEFT